MVESEITGEWYRTGATHAVYCEPCDYIECHDNTLCMYDYAKEILEIEENE